MSTINMANSRLVFNGLSAKFSQLLYGRTEGDRNLINKTLDEINALDYKYPVVTNVTKAVLLVNQCCSLVPPDDTYLVAKCCRLMTNLINRQHVQVEGRTLMITLQWCLHSLKQAEEFVIVDVLSTVDALLRSNVQCLHLLIQEIVATNSPLLLLAQKESVPEVVLYSAVQCLEACTIVPDDVKSTYENCVHQLELCTNVFLNYLIHRCKDDFSNLLCCKLLISCLNGLQNVIIQNHDYLNKDIGLLLGIVKSYMVYGIRNVGFVKPHKLMPSASSIPQPVVNPLREKKGGKMTKQRKHRKSGSSKNDSKKPEANEEWSNDGHFNGYIAATANMGIVNYSNSNSACYGNKLKTSDSDFSDSESGRTAKLGIMKGRVRQAALNLLLNIVKYTDKKTIFSYWSSFIPDGSPSGQHSLTTCILKDSSPRGRMAALNVLLALLSSSKLYLSQAEHSEKSTSFTPFSAVLGAMIQELHYCLRLALNENSIPVLTQVLKCLASLVQATPYHRLSPGIMSKVIRNVKVFVDHKDASVQVTALIVLGCALASEPVVAETREAFLKQPAHRKAKEIQVHKSTSPEKQTSDPQSSDFDFFDFSSDEEQEVTIQCGSEIPWLLEKCLKNLGVTVGKETLLLQQENIIPAPVKLESLQVMSAMTRNYFMSLMAPYLHPISKALEQSVIDKYMDLRLHAGRTVDFIGQAMRQHFMNNSDNDVLTVKEGLAFWTNLINGPLMMLIQNEQHATLRAVGCDCLGSIGPHVFEYLPRERQILIITSLLNCSRDVENSVKGAAVRALAISVLYPSLREDPGFVTDTAEAIYTTLTDENMMVRIKSSWSLGNLSDALVLNKTDSNITEEIQNCLLLKLIEAGIKGSSDNDKVRMNTVRALGSLLQLITVDLMADSKFKEVVERGIAILVGNSMTSANMKVRWNACYAIGNILKNEVLFQGCGNWQNLVFSNLSALVMGFRNFKVRINAALALSCPTCRELYGQYYHLTWNSLLKALENSENIEDFSEYKHRDHLVEQICLSIGHLTTFLIPDDLTLLQESFIFYHDILKAHMHRVHERLVPEKTEILFTAAFHVKNLSTHLLTSEQKEIVKSLIQVFDSDS